MEYITSYPTGLEYRFDEEMAAAVPGWKREFEAMPAPAERVRRKSSASDDLSQLSGGAKIRKRAELRKKGILAAGQRVRTRRFLKETVSKGDSIPS
jgi:hypothetical protein